jgi:glycosyltransferase involved in cell wall biosynthesis
MKQQVDKDIEHIVIDGGSTDGTLDILKKYGDKIRFTSGPDRGMSDALNMGFSLCTGEIVGWLNSDDLYLPGTLQKVADYFTNHSDCFWLYGHCRMVDENDREIRKWITAYKVRKSAVFNYHRLLVENYISQPSVFFRRSIFEKTGTLDVSLKTAMDYDLWLRFSGIGEPGIIHDFLSSFRVHHRSISARNFRKQFEEQYAIHQKYDQNKFRLFRHRMMILMIVGIYTVIDLARKKQ